MFYSKEILARKDTQLGLIWLAATLGPRSGINKLSKREVNGVNIVKTCKDISQPAEPFALRFSSNLMVGVTRVYSQQYNFYYSDVSNTWMRLKRDLAAVQSENLDMMTPGAKIDMITIGYDLTIEQDLFRPVNIVQNYEIEVARTSRGKEVAVEFGWATQSSLDHSDTSSNDQSPPPLFLSSVSDERRRKITLDERPGMAGVGPLLEFEAINAGLTDEMLMGDDNGLYIDAEGNLRADMPEQGFAIGDDRSMVSGLSETSVMARILGKHPREDSILSERIVPENNDIFDDILLDDRNYDIAFGIEMDGAGTGQIKKQRGGNRQQKLVGLKSDEDTILSKEELKAFRDNYVRDQAEIIRDREAKETVVSVKAHINRLLVQPLGVAGFGIDLGNFWSTAATHTLDNACVDRRVNAFPIEQPRNVQPIAVRGTHEQSWPPGDEDPLFMDEVPDPEAGRRLTNPPSVGTPAGASTGGFGGLDSVSSKGGPLPWEKEALGRSVGGRSERSSDSDHLWQGFDAAFDQNAGSALFPQHRCRTGSVDSRSSAESATTRGARAFGGGGLEGEEDEPLIRRRRHQSILGRSRTPSQESDRGRQPSLFVGGEMAEDGDGDDGGTGSAQERLALERATANFLGYIQSLLKPLNATSFSFEDIVAPHRRKDVAAAAFYHILGKHAPTLSSLSTMGVMRPKQDVSYQDIQVKLIG
ncbi:hypothetical protein BG015_009199 [Linnemannia schmuckeri]|uniref:Rad21/Rec8-like protein N-terminal domain-containing protein n=1 Tax=Linnemannia schmuckeri TaxID=64567 RepID=A0A9P5RZC5_9FUNG|nr:hypothetical protein BG015_009199 [Linnemannia schmuckeri]